MSQKSSDFRQGINDILEIASNHLAEASMKIQDEIDLNKRTLNDASWYKCPEVQNQKG